MKLEIDDYFNNNKKWQVELQQLRGIILNCLLTEEWKWRTPCYTYNSKNVVLLGRFKDYCSISFFKGALMHDKENLLELPGENSQTVRMMKFSGMDEILELKPTIKSYLIEAIEIEKAGLKPKKQTAQSIDYPMELKELFKLNAPLKKSFESLTPGRQRGYLIFFKGAKQSQTITTRIEKYIPRILQGKGIHDCICGHSKRMPTCDGSHKYI